jgi:branched-chain amino acid aminotransferase
MSRTWFNGSLVEGPLAVDRGERGLLLGDGLFETILVLNRTPLWGNMHFLRLEAAAQELGLAFDRDALDDAVGAILADAPRGHQVLRVTLTRGSGLRGLAADGTNPSLLLTLDPFDPALMFTPVTLASTAIRRNPASVASRHKTLSYADNIAAAREAAAKGADDALMRNTKGKVACSTIANVFLLAGGTLVTPARGEGILTGIMRQALLHSAARAGFGTQERAVTPAELRKADAVFLTNSLRFIRPVASLDGKQLKQGDLSPLVAILCEAARLQCGQDPRMVDLAPSGR